jgi:hypothetical protein
MNGKIQSSQPPESRMARVWRVFLDWDRAINTSPFEIMLESLEERVSKLEQEVWHSKDRTAQRKGSTQ